MQLTIDKSETNSLDIQPISQEDEDYQKILRGKEERKTNPENYGIIEDIKWDSFNTCT